MFGRGNLNPSKVKKMMKQMGVEMEELDNVEEVVVKLSDKELVFSSPQVQVTEAGGQKTYQVIGEPEERELEVEVENDDIEMVMEQANVSEEEAIQALEETKGNIAQAVVNLTES
ncbi:MAG: nascent polypeptide-associated complex protein [Candidatus Hadarchaeia archaeon]